MGIIKHNNFEGADRQRLSNPLPVTAKRPKGSEPELDHAELARWLLHR